MAGLNHSSTMMSDSSDNKSMRENMVSSPKTVMALPFEDDSSSHDFVPLGDMSSSPPENNNSSSTLASLGAMMDPKQATGEETAQTKGDEEETPSESENSSSSSIIPLSWLSVFDRCFADCQAIASEPKEFPYIKEEGEASAVFQAPEDKISDDVPRVVRAIKDGPPKPKLAALNEFYNMTMRDSAENRVPLVCRADWNVIPTLASVLVSDLPDRDKKLIGLSLVNLTVPIENKACLTLGANREVLLDSFWQLIFDLKPNAHFCCASLMNLAFLDDAKDILLHYIPTTERKDYEEDVVAAAENQTELEKTPCLHNPKSLLRALESMFIIYQQYCQDEKVSVEREAIRWGIGFLQQMTCCPERAAIIGQTAIPRIVFELLRDTNRPMYAWKEQSLEDMGLLLLLDFAKSPESCINLWTDKNCAHCLDHMIGKGGIHEVRAAAIMSRFEVGSLV